MVLKKMAISSDERSIMLLESDKATFELPAELLGVLIQTLVKKEQLRDWGCDLGVIEEASAFYQLLPPILRYFQNSKRLSQKRLTRDWRT